MTPSVHDTDPAPVPDARTPDSAGLPSEDSIADWIAAIAVPRPLPEPLDYCGVGAPPPVGARVRVPLGRGEVVGIVCAVNAAAQPVQLARPLRAVIAVLNDASVLPTDVLQLALWAANYYQQAPGEVLESLVPKAARTRRRKPTAANWYAIDGNPPTAARSPARARGYAALLNMPDGCPAAGSAENGLSGARLRDLARCGHAEARAAAAVGSPVRVRTQQSELALTADQAAAVTSITAQRDRFAALLLEGVTGSGKTEVYLRVIEGLLEAGQQALVLVPEIALTPQTVARFAERFPRTAASHSGLTSNQRAELWHACAAGEIDVIVGTRSAVFAPLPRLGLIVVDEEHDASFKQQEGFRYSARDLAVKRAHDLRIPIVLGSATPALETLLNVERGRYQALRLHARPGGAALPQLRVLDIRGERLDEGLSQPLLARIETRLQLGDQALLFLNRRGFAPSLVCAACGWVAECPACDARLTAHLTPRRLVCHHCDHTASWPAQCPQCQRGELQHLGLGTQRIELALARRFPQVPIVRIDRDIARSAQHLEAQFERVRGGEPMILIGTQMLAKGHHFPAVTLSAVLNADGGLLSADFRAPERTAQLIVQVAGRAGRTGRTGELWLQTYQPQHPVIQALQRGGYPAFARLALTERRAAGLPPFASMAVLRADGIDAARVAETLQALRTDARAQSAVHAGNVQVHGPVPAPLPRRAQRYRFQLALLGADRPTLHGVVTALRPAIERIDRRHVRVGIDIDPIDLY